ncbi:cutinase family protein [Rhodococcus hoagii]|nr:cutinase family protein [Prescottella equi]
MAIRFRTVVAAAVAASLTAVVSGTATASAAPSGCTPYMAVLVPGTWETNENADPNVPVGMLAEVGNGLKNEYGSKIKVVYPAYSASAFDKGKTYSDSQETGVAAVNRILQAACSGTVFLLGGYSQGAHVMGDVASSIGNGQGPIPASQVKAVGLVADPKRGPGSGQLIGPAVPGTGIAGTRPGGFGALNSVTKQLCEPGDLYCATDARSDGVLSALGQMIGNGSDKASTSTVQGGTGGGARQGGTTGGALQGGTTTASGQETATGVDPSDLVTDFSRANLSGLPSTTETMRQRLEGLPSTAGITSGEQASQIAGVGASASSLIRTLEPLQDVAEFAAANPTVAKSLSTAPAESSGAAAAKVLEAASKTDLTASLKAASDLSNAVSLLLSETTPTAGGLASVGQTGTQTVARTALAGQIDAVAAKLGPLGTMSPDTLSSAVSALSTLKPSTVITQVMAVGSHLGEFTGNLPGIGTNLGVLPQKIAALDIDGAHQVAGDLNNQFSPLVKMAAAVDFHSAAKVLAMIPDPSGYTQIAAMVLGLLGNLDIIRLANDVGQAQEVAWAALKDPTALAGLLPIGLDIASVAAGVLTGGAKTDPSLLGSSTPTSSQAAQLTASAQNKDLVSLGGTLTSLASSQSARDLVSLAKQGVDAASFYASGAHQSYGEFRVDGKTTALQWLTDYFAKSINTTA